MTGKVDNRDEALVSANVCKAERITRIQPPRPRSPPMPLNLHWFLPTAGDSRDVVGFGPTVSRREPDVEYLAQVARVAERVGFDAVLTPTGTFCEDAWLSTAALIRETTRLRFLVAFRPGLISPTLAAQP